jgi:hypothetical protein
VILFHQLSICFSVFQWCCIWRWWVTIISLVWAISAARSIVVSKACKGILYWWWCCWWPHEDGDEWIFNLKNKKKCSIVEVVCGMKFWWWCTEKSGQVLIVDSQRRQFLEQNLTRKCWNIIGVKVDNKRCYCSADKVLPALSRLGLSLQLIKSLSVEQILHPTISWSTEWLYKLLSKTIIKIIFFVHSKGWKYNYPKMYTGSLFQARTISFITEETVQRWTYTAADVGADLWFALQRAST